MPKNLRERKAKKKRAFPCGNVRFSRFSARKTSAVDVAEHFSAEDRGGAEFFFDAEELVVFRDAVGTAHRAGLDLARVRRDGDVGDRRVFRFAGAVRDDRRVAVELRHFDGVERFREGADLVDLDENRVRDAELDALLEEGRVRDEQVVADELDLAAELVRELCS